MFSCSHKEGGKHLTRVINSDKTSNQDFPALATPLNVEATAYRSQDGKLVDCFWSAKSSAQSVFMISS